MALVPRLFLVLLLSSPALGQAADLEIVSVVPDRPEVSTDQTFSFTAVVRNHGPASATAAEVVIGANALALLRSVTAPPGWTCDLTTPRFGYATTCSAPALASGADAALTLTLGAPQHSAMTYRVSARAATTTSDPVELNNGRDAGLPLQTSETHAELALSVKPGLDELAQLLVVNNGPHDARDVTVIVGQGMPGGPTVHASGPGWKCGVPGTSVSCFRAALKNGASASLTAGATAPAGQTVNVDSRVRAEKNYDSNGKNNAMAHSVVAKAIRSKRRASRP